MVFVVPTSRENKQCEMFKTEAAAFNFMSFWASKIDCFRKLEIIGVQNFKQ